MNLVASKYLMHGRDWEGDEPTGWGVGEKLEGVRCYWDGFNAWSKSGHRIELPERITGELPGTSLDGELYAGPGRFEIARSAVQYGRWVPEVQFIAFDKPDGEGDWLQRLALVAAVYPRHVAGHVCRSYAQLMDELRETQANGGEGLMIHSPDQTRYTPGRTSLLLKVKLVLPMLTCRRASPRRGLLNRTNPETVS